MESAYLYLPQLSRPLPTLYTSGSCMFRLGTLKQGLFNVDNVFSLLPYFPAPLLVVDVVSSSPRLQRPADESISTDGNYFQTYRGENQKKKEEKTQERQSHRQTDRERRGNTSLLHLYPPPPCFNTRLNLQVDCSGSSDMQMTPAGK